MKIRNGFVSNSSSSSFIVLLPKGFDADKFADNLTDEQLNPSKWDSYDREEVREGIKLLMEQKSLWYDQGIVGRLKYNYLYPVSEMLSEYIIGSTEGGPDDGSISLVSDSDRERIKEILKNE